MKAYDRLTDLELVEMAREGQEPPFAELMRRYEDKMYGLALRMTRNPEDALEVAQDAFFKAYKALDRFRGASAFSTWLYSITCNTARNKLRTRNRRRVDQTLSIDEEREGLPKMDPPSDDPSPSDKLQAKHLAEAYTRALDQLAEPFRETILLRDSEGLSYEEIASALGVSKGTVKSRISRGREELRRVLIARGLLEASS